MITEQELTLLAIKAGGAVLGIIALFWTRIIVLGKDR